MENLQQVGLGYNLTQQIGRGCIVKESLWLAVLGFTPAAESGTGLRGEKQGDLSCLDRNWKY